MSSLRVGQIVRALSTVTESGLPSDPHVHGRPGDLGQVEDITDGFPTVRFFASGTATIVHPRQVRGAE
jgi:hypothetical protein